MMFLLLIYLSIYLAAPGILAVKEYEKIQDSREYTFDISVENCTNIEYRTANHEGNYDEYDYGECENENQDVKRILGDNVLRCCGDHGFMTLATCPGGPKHELEKEDYNGVPVCVLHNAEKRRHELNISSIQNSYCPQHCHLQHFKEVTEADFRITNEKTFFIQGNRDSPFCVGHACHYETKWKLEVYACSCASPRDVAVKARKQLGEVPICCPVDSYLEISVSNTFKCVQETKNMEDPFEFLVSTPNCTWTNGHEFEVIDLEKIIPSSDIFCVGAVKQHRESVYQIRGIGCRLACDGKQPCVRRCGNNGTWWDESGWSIDQTPEEKDYFNKNNIHVEYGIVPKDPMMDMVILYPLGSCLDKFILDVNSSSLYLPARNTTLHYGEFCLAPRNPANRKGGLFLQANMLLEESSGKVQKYQAYILLISVVCLIITIIVYSVLPVMLNNYFKIMLNFAISMLAGFLSLTAVKMKPWFAHEYSFATCKLLGYFNQFFLIAMFTWMTMMSYEIFKQIKGLKQKIGRGNLKQLSKKLMVGYGVPFFIVFCAVVVDFSAEGTEQDCGLLRPKFGIRFCTFNNRDDKFFWLLLPILVMLILNTLMFIYIVTEICRNASVRNDFRSGGANRKEQIDKMLLYLRLFFGMGFVWYFEILSFLLDTPNSDWTWFPDTLNMLQGVWVFVTFVCKRNVLNIIMKKKDRLYVSLRRSTIGDNGEIKVKLSEIRSQKEVTSVLSTRVSASIFDLDPSTTKSHKQQQRQ